MSATELSRLIGWDHDGIVTRCVDCQWMRGDTPRFVDRYAQRRPEPKPWMKRLVGADASWRGGPGASA